MHRGAKHADLDFLATSALPVLGVQRRREGCRGVHGGVFLAHHALHKRFVFRLQDSRFKIQDLKIQALAFTKTYRSHRHQIKPLLCRPLTESYSDLKLRLGLGLGVWTVAFLSSSYLSQSPFYYGNSSKLELILAYIRVGVRVLVRVSVRVRVRDLGY